MYVFFLNEYHCLPILDTDSYQRLFAEDDTACEDEDELYGDLCFGTSGKLGC